MISISMPEGMTLSKIAATYGLAPDTLAKINPDIEGDDIPAYTMLNLPLDNVYLGNIPNYDPDRDTKVDLERQVTPDEIEWPWKVTETRTEDYMPPAKPHAPVAPPVDNPLPNYEKTMDELFKTPDKPTPNWLEHLKEREGVKHEVYLDKLGKPTAGIGHYDPTMKVGEKVTSEQVNEWLTKDTQKAWEAALKQAQEIGRTDTEFVQGLASVNFQLGTEWYKEHVKTWGHLKNQEWDLAAAESQRSEWFKQTPVRVKDFQASILARPKT